MHFKKKQPNKKPNPKTKLKKTPKLQKPTPTPQPGTEHSITTDNTHTQKDKAGCYAFYFCGLWTVLH